MYRGQLDQKRCQRLDAEKKVGELRKKEAEKRKEATRAREAAARSSTQSTICSGSNEADRREKEANAALLDAANWPLRLFEFHRGWSLHAADFCGRVIAMWLRIRRW